MKILMVRGKNLASLEEFRLDFRVPPLANAGLFAITGPTGAGKSTILDAICLALFDATPRLKSKGGPEIGPDEEGMERLTAQDRRTLVRRGTSIGVAEVEFEGTDGDVYRATWQVSRARGSPKGKLKQIEWRLTRTSDGIVIAEKKKEEVGSAIEARLGLSFDQFRRAVLLAQGDFAAFLTAKEKDRSELLEKITGLEVYASVSRLAFERAKRAKENLAAAQWELDQTRPLSDEERAAKRLEATRIETLRNGANELVARIAVAIAAGDELGRAGRRLADATEEAHRSTEALTALREKGRALNLWISEHQEIGLLAAAWDARSQDIEDLVAIRAERTELEADVRAAVDARAEQEALESRCKSDLKSALDATSSAETELGEAEQAVSTSDLAEIGRHSTAVVARRGILNRLDMCARAAIENEATRAAEEERAAAAREAAVAKDEEAQGALLAGRRLQDELQEMNNRLRAAEATLNLEAQRASLREGTPCPLCGSLQHPWADRGAPESAEITGLRDARTILEKRVHDEGRNAAAAEQAAAHLRKDADEGSNRAKEAKAKLVALQRDWNDLLKDLSDDTGFPHILPPHPLDPNVPASLAAASAGVAAALRTADEEVRKAKSLAAAVVGVRRKLEEVRKAAQERKDDLARAVAELAALSERIGSGKRVTGALQAKEHAVASRLSGVATVVDHGPALLDTDPLKLKDAADRLITGHRQSQDELRKVDLDTKEAETLARSCAAAVASAGTEKEDTNRRRDRALADAGVSSQEALDAARESTTSDRDRLQEDLTRLQARLAQDDTERARKAEAQERLDDAKRSADVWLQLNDVIGSSDGKKFRTFAQGVTLTTLLALANEHLNDLAPRYRLQKVPGCDMELQIVDRDMADDVRSVDSLSGGETFLVSLALALGLSSLATKRTSIGSLFIDEGFGALDPATLDQAISVLEALHHAGRTVGVISHVEGLAERIGVQVKVERTSPGTSAVTVVGTL